MASIGHDSGGRRRILFVAGDGKRKTIRLGKCSTRQAESVKTKVEDLVVSASGAGTMQDETARWLDAIDDRLHEKLAAVGLVRARARVDATIGGFFRAYIDGRTDIKPNTRIQLEQTRTKLIAYFGEDRRLTEVSPGDAEEYWRHLNIKLSVNSARRLCGRAKQVFAFAIRKRLIRENPFAEIESHVRGNPERQRFIPRDVADKVLAGCPDAEWRLIFALSRYGGLRCPSEHLSLKWSDVDWERGRVRAWSPKTEHIEGRESRVIPMFPELRAPLLEVFERAQDGAEYVVTRYRQRSCNLRTQFQRIIRRAGVDLWPKLFHNLRASRQTELEETYPGHVVCAWLGNTEDVAREHYLQVTEAHFARASASGAGDNKSAADVSKAAQKAAQQPPETIGNARNQGDSICEIAQKSQQNENFGCPGRESNPHALAGIGF
jgi:integrase